jgi:hypothetical protein
MVYKRSQGTGPSGLKAQLDMLAPSFRSAVHEMEKAYRKLGVRHVLIGGLAAGAYGEPRATRDVDFLVGDEAFDVAGPVISFRAGIPMSAYGIATDSVPVPESYRRIGEEALAGAMPSDEPGIEIAPPAHLAALKLVAGRAKDLLDVQNMLRSGATTERALGDLIRRLGDDRLATRLKEALRRMAEDTDE